MERETVSLILPVHNEAKNIGPVIQSFYNEINGIVSLQIIVAEDGSTDGTKKELKKLSRNIPMVLLMDDNRLGYGGGLKKGLQKAAGEYVLFCDSDGQHLASDFWELYNARDGFDMIDGWRHKRADTLFRRMMSTTFQIFGRLLFGLKNLRDITAPYRLVKKDLALKIARQVKYMGESFWTEFTIRAIKHGAKIREVPVKHKLRFAGDTVVYTPKKLPKIVYKQFKAMLKIWVELRPNKTIFYV
jgi:glycosyltransferase involved in cell wall biosynthesis